MLSSNSKERSQSSDINSFSASQANLSISRQF